MIQQEKQQTEIPCQGCKQPIRQQEFKKHIRICPKYEGVAYKWIHRLPKLQPLLLKFIIAQLDVCREMVQEKLFEVMEIKWAEQKNKAQHENQMIDIPYDHCQNTDIVSCNKCNNKFYASFDTNSLCYVQDCWHLFCKTCLIAHIDKNYVNSGGNVTCPAPDCNKQIDERQVRELVGEVKFEEIHRRALKKMMNMNLIQCVKCHEQYDFRPGNPRDAPAKDQNGKALTQNDKNFYAENRFICPRPNCKTEQCKSCSVTPFHIGMNCQDFKKRSDMMKCRYCNEPITEKNRSHSNIQALMDICNSKQCKEQSANACTKILACGHPCYGSKGQAKCLPCLHPSCCENNEELNGQTGDDYCNICFVEGLSASPCLRSGCGHIFHEKCLKKRYEIRWLTPRIFFNFCQCPLCKKWVTLPNESRLHQNIVNNLELHQKIQKMALQRLKFEECEKDDKLVNPSSPYYKKPEEYAMAIYAYFECFKCKNPYFGGRKNCAEAMGQQQAAGSFKAQQLICPNCCQIPIQNCSKHGNDFIEFKCKFCCSTAQWFCWGNTHFCQPCHKRQCDGDYVSKYTKDKLPKCAGPGKCPAGGNHNGNGEEKSLGCAICRNIKANNKGF